MKNMTRADCSKELQETLADVGFRVMLAELYRVNAYTTMLQSPRAFSGLVQGAVITQTQQRAATAKRKSNEAMRAAFPLFV